MNNIKSVRRALKEWGRYWASKEELQGYSNKSNIMVIKECCELGGMFKSDAHLYSHGSSVIQVPAHIDALGARINTLSAHESLLWLGDILKALQKQTCGIGLDFQQQALPNCGYCGLKRRSFSRGFIVSHVAL